MYTYTYALIGKVITVQLNKVQQIDLVNKGNRKLYFPAKNKTDESINWKTKLKQGAKWGINQ